jgi:hypothetical protein
VLRNLYNWLKIQEFRLLITVLLTNLRGILQKPLHKNSKLIITFKFLAYDILIENNAISENKINNKTYSFSGRN